MKMQGWKTASMFRRYGIVDHADMIDAVQRQEAYEARVREEAEALAKQLKEAQTLEGELKIADEKKAQEEVTMLEKLYTE